MTVRGAVEEEPVESARRGAFESLRAFAQSSDVLALLDLEGVIVATNRPLTDTAGVGRALAWRHDLTWTVVGPESGAWETKAIGGYSRCRRAFASARS